MDIYSEVIHKPASADADYHEQEKIINQLRMRVAVLEQEIKDKEQVLTKSSDLLGAEQEKKVYHLFCMESNVSVVMTNTFKRIQHVYNLFEDWMFVLLNCLFWNSILNCV